MASFGKFIAFSLAASTFALPAHAQSGAGIGDETRRQLAALRQQEAEVRHRIGQLQLDALIERVGRAVERRAPARPSSQPVSRWTVADLSL